MKNAVFWDVMPCGSCKNRRFGEKYRLIIRVARIGKLGTTLAVTSNRYVPPKRRFLQDLHGVISQKTAALFLVTAVKTSNLTSTKECLSYPEVRTYCLKMHFEWALNLVGKLYLNICTLLWQPRTYEEWCLLGCYAVETSTLTATYIIF
jgi:hypothetical protein